MLSDAKKKRSTNKVLLLISQRTQLFNVTFMCPECGCTDGFQLEPERGAATCFLKLGDEMLSMPLKILEGLMQIALNHN
jgi:hypothetical protein